MRRFCELFEEKSRKMKCSYPPLSLLANQFIYQLRYCIFVHCIGCVLEAVDRCGETAAVGNSYNHPLI